MLVLVVLMLVLVVVLELQRAQPAQAVLDLQRPLPPLLTLLVVALPGVASSLLSARSSDP